ncbi:RelA/SpoT domain-containing protein [Photobacterium leiognathi]|uniref:RelA/SpoT domain-containing protein n=1 Tax=Photobacterium leiognathi TaxID=553611 RepID=UPI002982015A|nr:RelA/SpoT domain-containing protein [Photobacterium leiognathi]
MSNESAIAVVQSKVHEYKIFAERILSYINHNPVLRDNVHSHKYRVKDLTHLDAKISRKNEELQEKGEELISSENILKKVTDISGIRILHLHQGQLEHIHRTFQEYVENGDIFLYEQPKAYTWDPEYGELFSSLGMDVRQKDSFYTSVHYVFKASENSDVTCEVQVRTLFEEVWGELDHTVNYPTETDSLAIKEQLKVFARIVGAGTRMSHSIFKLIDMEAGN